MNRRLLVVTIESVEKVQHGAFASEQLETWHKQFLVFDLDTVEDKAIDDQVAAAIFTAKEALPPKEPS